MKRRGSWRGGRKRGLRTGEGRETEGEKGQTDKIKRERQRLQKRI